jgi:hypothetical protein
LTKLAVEERSFGVIATQRDGTGAGGASSCVVTRTRGEISVYRVEAMVLIESDFEPVQRRRPGLGPDCLRDLEML